MAPATHLRPRLRACLRRVLRPNTTGALTVASTLYLECAYDVLTMYLRCAYHALTSTHNYALTCVLRLAQCVTNYRVSYYLRTERDYVVRVSARAHPHASTRVMVVEYMDRARGHTVDFFAQTLRGTHTNPAKSLSESRHGLLSRMSALSC